MSTLFFNINEMHAMWCSPICSLLWVVVLHGVVRSLHLGFCDTATSSLVLISLENWFFFFFLLWLFLKCLKNKYRGKYGRILSSHCNQSLWLCFEDKAKADLSHQNNSKILQCRASAREIEGLPFRKWRVTLRNGWKEIWKCWQIV